MNNLPDVVKGRDVRRLITSRIFSSKQIYSYHKRLYYHICISNELSTFQYNNFIEQKLMHIESTSALMHWLSRSPELVLLLPWKSTFPLQSRSTSRIISVTSSSVYRSPRLVIKYLSSFTVMYPSPSLSKILNAFCKSSSKSACRIRKAKTVTKSSKPNSPMYVK